MLSAHYGFCDKKASLALRKSGSRFQAIRTCSTFRGSRAAQARSLRASRSRSAWRWAFAQKAPRASTRCSGTANCRKEVGRLHAAHHKLDNLCAIIDHNKLQSDDRNANIMASSR